jgi:hypothetical protein
MSAPSYLVHTSAEKDGRRAAGRAAMVRRLPERTHGQIRRSNQLRPLPAGKTDLLDYLSEAPAVPREQASLFLYRPPTTETVLVTGRLDWRPTGSESHPHRVQQRSDIAPNAAVPLAL